MPGTIAGGDIGQAGRLQGGKLPAREPLDDVRCSGDGVELSADAPRSIVSVALRVDASAARAALARALGGELPDVGSASGVDIGGGAAEGGGAGDRGVADGTGSATVLGLQSDQWFVSLPAIDSPVHAVREIVGEAPALTDQSDAWVALVVEGPRATLALERMCRLDLHVDAFPPGRVARTAIEHMAVIVLRETAQRFVLLSPRSSAASFAHALETSVRYVS